VAPWSSDAASDLPSENARIVSRCSGQSQCAGLGRHSERGTRRTSLDPGKSLDRYWNVTVVSNTILSKLGVPPYAQAQTQSIGGSLHVQLYRVSISILDESDPHSPRYIQPDLVIMEMPSLLNVDVLLGMDVIMGCRMLVDGPAQQLILEF